MATVFGLIKYHYPMSIRHNNKDYMLFFSSHHSASYIANMLKRDSIIRLDIKEKVIKLPTNFLSKKFYNKNKTFNLYPYVNISIQKSDSSLHYFIDIDEVDYDIFLSYPLYRSGTILVSNIISETKDEIILNSTISESIIPEDIPIPENIPP